MSARSPRPIRQRGVTLVELMFVVIIIGIMSTTAVVMLNTQPKARDIAHRLSGFIGEAERLAVAGGATENGQPRTRVEISGLAGDQFAIIERWDDSTASWEEVSSYKVATNVDVVGFRLQAETADGANPNYVLANGDIISLACRADGTCEPDNPPGVGLTIYLREIDNPGSEARVVVVPLGGSPLVYDSW